MIISRRRFEAALNKAIEEYKCYTQLEARVVNDQFHNSLEFERLWKAIHKLEERVMTGKEAQHERSDQPKSSAC